MSLVIESKKLKRTGYLPAFLAGGFLAAAFPVVYMMAKAEEMTSLSGNPLEHTDVRQLADDGDAEYPHFHLRRLYDVPHGICR